MKIYIEDLQEKQSVQSTFLVREKTLNTGKTGKHYLALVLGDRTGTIEARIWESAQDWNERFDSSDFIDVKGFVQSFQNRKQLVIQNLEVTDPLGIELGDYLPASKRDSAEMYRELKDVLSLVKNPNIKKLIDNTLEDPEIKPLFMSSPAAKTIHHAYIGGLLEHVLSISQMMVKIADHYKVLDLDLLLFGAVYHDIGKIWELSFETGFGYTDVGRLVGHIPLGSELVEKKASEIPNFPFELKNVLKHIVLSHHGRMDYGSPKRPKFLEAFVVAFIDDLDSKVNALDAFIRGEKSSGATWTKYNQMYDRYFYTQTMQDLEE